MEEEAPGKKGAKKGGKAPSAAVLAMQQALEKRRLAEEAAEQALLEAKQKARGSLQPLHHFLCLFLSELLCFPWLCALPCALVAPDFCAFAHLSPHFAPASSLLSLRRRRRRRSALRLSA